VLVAEIVPPFANVNAVGVTPIVSIVATPVNAPPVVTLRPDDVRANVPVAVPIAVLAVPVVLMLVAPVTVNPLLAVSNPCDVNVPDAVRFAPTAVNDVAPPEEITTFPVELLPRVNVCPLVVAS